MFRLPMPDTQLTRNDPLQARARRAGRSFADLNARIARLAMFVGASLSSQAEIQKIIHRQVPFYQTHVTAAGGSAAHGASDRTAQEWEELRGLLVLRCNLMASMLNELGLPLTEQIVMQAEEHLERVGFKRGADGFALLPRQQP